MSVCGSRPETPGFFTACRNCACGKAVAEEQDAEREEGGAERRPNDNGGRG
jgi:hypothetical protein